jgi:hypothetical protein
VLIATFGPTTTWVGIRITWADDGFVLEGHGPISAGDVMEYDQQGHLLWVNEGARAWVGATASRRPKKSAARASTAVVSQAANPAEDGTRGESTYWTKYLKYVLLAAIVVLVLVNAVLLLVLAGVLHLP